MEAKSKEELSNYNGKPDSFITYSKVKYKEIRQGQVNNPVSNEIQFNDFSLDTQGLNCALQKALPKIWESTKGCVENTSEALFFY
jgi:hypothetical protein